MQWNRLANLRRSSIIITGCFLVLGGIGASKLYSCLWLGYLVFSNLALMVISRQSKWLLAALYLVAAYSLGWWRGSIYVAELNKIKTLDSRQVELVAIAQNDSVYGANSQITFDVSSVSVLKPQQVNLKGSYKISGFGEPMIYKGDRVELVGKLHLSRGSHQASLSYAQMRKLSAGSGWLDNLRRKFVAGLENALPDPEASLGLGLLIGQRSSLPPEILNILTTVGLVHIVAVSGYNVTILQRAVQRLKLARSKYQQLIFSLLFIGLFILITGFSASIVRAGLVALLSLWAWYFGRQFRPLMLISFVAALTALINPFYLWSDIGWYLSFLAFFGILILAPLISKRLFRMAQPKAVVLLVIETSSAQLMTLPLIMVIFGRLSVVSIVANLLVVPLVPVAMLLALSAGLAGMLLPQFAGWIAWPAEKLLTYMIDISTLCARLPLASINVGVSWPQVILIYMIIIFITFFLANLPHNKPKQQFLAQV